MVPKVFLVNDSTLDFSANQVHAVSMDDGHRQVVVQDQGCCPAEDPVAGVVNKDAAAHGVVRVPPLWSPVQRLDLSIRAKGVAVLVAANQQDVTLLEDDRTCREVSGSDRQVSQPAFRLSVSILSSLAPSRSTFPLRSVAEKNCFRS